jgi:hypothetical protein
VRSHPIVLLNDGTIRGGGGWESETENLQLIVDLLKKL